MAKTKSQAMKEAKMFLRRFPSRDVQIIEHTGVKRGSSFKFNFRFPSKTGTKNKIRFKKEF